MARYYDRQGRPIEMLDWARKFEDYDYKLVAKYEDENVMISTVWLGLDHGWSGGRPIIFETMIFTTKGAAERCPFDKWQWRYYTEEEAKEGHELVVAAYHENRDPEEAIKAWQEHRRKEGMN